MNTHSSLVKPDYWFRTPEEFVEDYRSMKEPNAIEYLNADTGETYVHLHGTAFWDHKEHTININKLALCFITHLRIRKDLENK